MHCSRCGTENIRDARFCANCGIAIGEWTAEPYARDDREQGRPPPPHVPNYLVQAILVTIFCCLPFGIVSIVYAAQVNGRLDAGDVAAARRLSASAKTWAWVSFGVGLGIGGIYLFLMLVGVVAGI